MEINGGEVIEVPKTIRKEASSSNPAKPARRDPDRAEADSQLAEQENGPEGKHDIPNDDQDPGGEVGDEEVEAAAKKAAVGLNLLHPAGDERQAALAEGEHRPLQPFRMGRQHAGGDKTGGLAAATADHGHGPAATGLVVGQAEADQPTTKDQDRLRHRRWRLGGR